MHWTRRVDYLRRSVEKLDNDNIRADIYASFFNEQFIPRVALVALVYNRLFRSFEREFHMSTQIMILVAERYPEKVTTVIASELINIVQHCLVVELDFTVVSYYLTIMIVENTNLGMMVQGNQIKVLYRPSLRTNDLKFFTFVAEMKAMTVRMTDSWK